MKKYFRHLFLAVVAVMAFSACQEDPRNTEELVDPWLRERTPVNLRLESQVGAAVISDNWRDDTQGSVVVNLITGGLDLSAVKVVALDFEFPESEYCPTASIAPGSTLDLSDGSAEFTVTAYNGETRVYSVNYTQFKDPLEGTYSFTPVDGILDSSAPKSACIVHGGQDGGIVLCAALDKWWQWGTDYMPTDEDDNILSFRLEEVDSDNGNTFGTVVNTPGPDGKYANYNYQNKIDMNEKYRLFPVGKGRWANLNDGFITVYAYEDAEYQNPLRKVKLLEKGDYEFAGDGGPKVFSVPHLAFRREFEGPFNNMTDDWSDNRWYVNNVRNILWLVKKDSSDALENHSELLAQ